jgi:hypothetical protein
MTSSSWGMTVMAMLEFERLLDKLGVQWAPHKQCGPCSAIEFLGLMLLNTPKVPRCESFGEAAWPDNGDAKGV